MRLIYLAGPYSHKKENVRQERLSKHAQVLAYFAHHAKSLHLYSPIVHWHGVASEHELPKDFNFWMEHDFFMIRLSSAVWVITSDGWKTSFGLEQEMAFAQDIKKEIFYVIEESPKFHITDTRPD